MSLDAILPLAVAAGHAGVVVYIVNVTHALGMTEKRVRWLKLLLGLAVLASTAALAMLTLRGPWSTWPVGVRAYALLCLAVAFVGIPFSTALIRCRRFPSGITETARQIDLAARHGADAMIGPGKHSWVLRLPGNESLRLRTREWQVTLPGLPAEWDGLSLVQLSDLHFAPCFDRRFFERVADEAAGWDADLVFFTGDLVDHDDAHNWVVPVLSRLRGRVATCAILGNHDLDHHPERLGRLLEEAGFLDLEGRWSRFEYAGRNLAVGGTSFPWGPPVDLDSAAEADLRILLSHTPDLFYRAVGAGIDLMLSGHNHGGQIRVPVLGPILMPSRYSRRFDRGFFQSRRTLLHVSQGVAGKHPIRYGCVPEISRLVLRAGRELSRGTSAAGRHHFPGDRLPTRSS